MVQRAGVFSFFLVILVGLTSLASSNSQNYYGSEFLTGFLSGKLQNQELKDALFRVLSEGHLKNQNSPDTLVPSCSQAAQNTQKCQEHVALGYDRARVKLFGTIHLKQIAGVYTVTDVYCERDFTDKDFGGAPNIGPHLIPSNGSILNTEHTWPQSRFTSRFNKEMQKSDLHHLYPTDSQMNSYRGALQFGQVKEEVETLKCTQNKLGHSDSSGRIVFEVPDQHKGNAARAIFYFATRYQMKVSPQEEAALRAWNDRDPVDEFEQTRNDLIEQFQGNRNPYVDFPELLGRIDHF